MTPADRLRAAAEKIRTIAADERRWDAALRDTPLDTPLPDEPDLLLCEIGLGHNQGNQDLALEVADWLESESEALYFGAAISHRPDGTPHSPLTIADLILGGE